ncbi:hypothetical protein [Pontibacterium sp.]|uniref:hypothetical protein n=1 Tax=Pontibacterium sp. TaxID=2036026 RepID=UPI003568E8AD
MIIGLMGGESPRRTKIAKALQASSSTARVLDLNYPRLCDGNPTRMAQRRVEALNQFLQDDGGRADELQVVMHVLSMEEAQVLRAKGAFMWNCEGPPSKEIPIERHDLMVTDQGAFRPRPHFLMPEEALSEARRRAGL